MKNKKSVSLGSVIVIAVIILGAYFFASSSAKRDIERSGYQPGEQLPAQAGSLSTPVVTYSNLTCNSVTLNWNKVTGAKGYEVYGPASVCNVSGSAGYCGKTSSRSKNITGLQPSTYYSNLVPGAEGFTVLAYKGSSYSAPATRLNIQTPSCGGGNLIPTVAITSHGGVVTVTNPFIANLSGTSTNATLVQWSVNGGATQLATGTSPWTISNIPLNVGTNTITIHAVGSNANLSVPAILTVVYVHTPIDNIAPTTTTAAPSSSWANTNIARTLTCTDAGGSGCANTYWKFVATGTSCGTGPATFTSCTNATTTAQGQWRLCYYSVDSASVPNTENPVVFQESYKLNSGLPKGTLTSPTSGQTLSGTVTLTANATDTLSGVASVAFRVDGVTVSTDTTSPYTASWNSTSVSNGSHVFSTIVTDVAGNSLTTANITAAVSNSIGLATPTNLAASGLTCNAFNLTWTPVAGATGYEIYGPNGCNGGTSNYCGSSTSASKSITGLTASTTYSGSTGSTAGFTVLAYNSAGVYSSPATWLTVTTPSSSSCGGTNSAPTVSITGPTSSSSYTSSSSTISLSGTATDDVSVASVTWQNQTTGATGTATGTSSWSTSAITLQGGVNTIIVTARDGANPSLTGTDTITVTYGTPSVSSWPASNTGTQIGGSLTSLFEPSGAFWNPADQMLYFASDHGMITKMNQNGGSLTSWSVSGNFEGITGTGGNASYTASMDKVYVIDENTSQIKEIGPTGTITKTWTLPSNVTSQLDVSGNLGAEGITWVPNGSHPYGNTATGGIFYVGSQKDGKIFAVEVDLSLPSGTLQSTALKGTIQPQLITPGTANLSDIAYIPSTNKLIAIYDGLNIIHEMLPNGFIIGEYRLPVVSGASGEEGIAMIPTCNGTQTTIVLGYDPSGAHNVYKFSNYPQPCADSAGPLVTNKAVNVSQSGSTYTAAITWDTNEYSDSKIEYGVGNYGTTYFETPLKTTAHFVALSGLPTGQTYQYKITSRDQAGNPSVQATGTFNTGTVSGTSKVVVAAGDISCDYCNQMQVSNWIMNNIGSIDAVLPLGDLTYGDTSDNNPADGTLGAFNDYYAPSWGRPAIRAKTNPSPGNHEYYVSNASGYFDYFNGVGVNTGMAGTRGQGYYSYNVGDWHLLSLNSNEKCTVVSCGAGSAQETWMRSDLDANNSLCEIAYWHHPRFSNGDHGDTSAVDALWKAAADKGVDIILTGHDHGYERLKPMDRSGALNANGIRSFVVGSGGMVDFYPITTGTDQDVRIQNTNGILKLTLHSTSYEWQFVRTSDGVVLDSSPAPVSCH